MKKKKPGIIWLVLFCLAILARCVCSEDTSHYKFRQDISQIEKIEIVHKVEDNALTLDPVEILLTINKDEHAEIIEMIQSLPCGKYWNDPPVAVGEYQFRIYYTDGEIEMLGDHNNAFILSEGKLRIGPVYFHDNSLTQLILTILEMKTGEGLQP